jgi:hypothetical protein
MNPEFLQAARKIILDWQRTREHTYENKLFFGKSNPSMPEELLIYFTNSVYSFFCGNNLIPITLTSAPFFTATLSANPISQNQNADLSRLKQFLIEFDQKFYALIQQKLEDCPDKISSSDPFWF